MAASNDVQGWVMSGISGLGELFSLFYLPIIYANSDLSLCSGFLHHLR